MRLKRILLIVLMLALPMLAATVRANGPNYTLDWWTVDGGGGTWSDTGGQYVLNGTVGQPDAYVWGDGEYTLIGGFWGGGAVQYRIYLPLVVRDN
jgi:hypothetical protein